MKEQRCNNHSIKRDWIETFVLNKVDEYIGQLTYKKKQSIYQFCWNSIANSNQPKINALNKEVRKIDKELLRISGVITLINSSTLIEKLTLLEQQKEEIQLRIKKLSKEERKNLSEEEIDLLLLKLRKMLKEKSIPQLKELMYLIVNKILVNEKDVVVYLNIPNLK